MPYTFQLYIAVFSPSIALRLFGEVVLPGGGASYELSEKDGAYVLRSRYIAEWERTHIHEATGMQLRTCETCSVLRPDEVNADELIIRLIDWIAYEIGHEFLLVENDEDIIIIRNDLDLLITQHGERLDYDFHELVYQIRDLPKLNLKEEKQNGNDMDNRN